jgi:nucleoside-triphosphatase
MTAPRVLLLTGRPGIGKTTVLLRLAGLLADRRFVGFTTAEIREAGRRVGFRGTTLDGREVVIAHEIRPGSPRVGRYGVDIDALAVLAASLAPDAGVELYLIDEIGKMECLCPQFVAAVEGLLRLPVPVVATVSELGGGLIAEVKRWPGATLLQVTHANRDLLPTRLTTWLFDRTDA